MIVLASASPRRAELLRQIGVAFEVQSADIDESVLEGESAGDYVCRLALEKARTVYALRNPGELVLAADTAVVLDEKILGKPVDLAEWRQMLERLSGATHEVMTGFALVSGARHEVQRVISQVRFASLSASVIAAYMATNEGLDKAGGYGIQGVGAILVEHMSGSYSNVVGLPLFETAEMLESFGYRVPAEGGVSAT
ncbi:MAG: Maf family protein [Oceanobacter sp.]